MVFTTGQWLGIAAFTAIVIVVGIALLKLDSMIGTNHETIDPGPNDALTLPMAPSAPVGNRRATSRTRRRRH